MTDQEIVDVVRAHMEGKKIEIRDKEIGVWMTHEPFKLGWNFVDLDYRVAKEPRRVWLQKEVVSCSKGFLKKCWVEADDKTKATLFVEVLP